MVYIQPLLRVENSPLSCQLKFVHDLPVCVDAEILKRTKGTGNGKQVGGQTERRMSGLASEVIFHNTEGQDSQPSRNKIIRNTFFLLISNKKGLGILLGNLCDRHRCSQSSGQADFHLQLLDGRNTG